MKYLILIPIFLITSKVFSSPYFDYNDEHLKPTIYNLEKQCEISILDDGSYPISYAQIIKIVEYKSKKVNEPGCIDEIKNIKKQFNKDMLQNSYILGFQSKADSFYMQDYDQRVYQESNFYFKGMSSFKNYYVNFEARKNINGDFSYDNTYISSKKEI